VLHAIEKDRNRRFQNMNEFLAALENPEAHAAQWSGLPAYSAAGAATLQTFPAVKQPPKQGRTLALEDGAPPAVPGGPPRPTTLEGAAAEVTFPPTRVPRNRAPLIAVGAAVLALAGVGGWLGLSSKKSSTTTEPATQPPEVEAPKTVTPPNDEVTVMVVSDPLGAKVYRADKSEAETQPTPITFRIKKGDPPFDIQLRAEGYVPQTRTITSEQSVKMVVALAKLPTAAPAPTPTPTPTRTPTPTPTKTPTVEAVAKPAVPKVTKVKKPKSPKSSEPDPDGIIQPSFGN